MKDEAKNEIAHKRHMQKMMRAIYIVAAIGVVLSVYVYASNLPPPVGKYDTFASCSLQAARHSTARSCPHCQAQKAEFGSSAHLLPYVECSLPDASGQDQICNDKGIQSYPTWYFADQSSSTGEQPLATLAQKTGCALPQ
jgi:hypothetical protein